MYTFTEKEMGRRERRIRRNVGQGSLEINRNAEYEAGLGFMHDPRKSIVAGRRAVRIGTIIFGLIEEVE